jgi:hypothetical protein
MSAQQRKAKKTPKKALATNYALEWRILWNHKFVYAWVNSVAFAIMLTIG